MLELLIETDQQIFLTLNAMHWGVTDFFWSQFSKNIIWLPLYVWLIFLIWNEYKIQIWKVLLSISLLILVSDQTSNLAKNGFQRLRPCHDALIGPQTHTVNNNCGGSYGFFSGHAANSFAIFAFITSLFRKKHRNIERVMLAYAILVSLSRIFLGVHYPLDILAGAITGLLYGAMFGQLFLQYFLQPPKANT
jgi:undecaprenyl-diphosphatase